MKSYDHKKIEKKWREEWEKRELYRADDNSSKEKKYILDMFPYPSAAGLHVGHVEGYTATDIYSRYLRMRRYNVLHPMGWDAFGLPAENYAIKTKVHPKKTTNDAIENFKSQIKALGLSYDWSREIGTHTPEYYKWTQWFFLLLYKHGLAYKAKAKVNWCPKDQTVLANEQVVEGACERCGTEVVQKNLEQWFFRITKYADDLIADLDLVDWPESTKAAQRNWIGKSEGAEIDFELTSDDKVTVFTTRADTLFGATYLVLAPEHPWVSHALQHKGLLKNEEEVGRYIALSAKKTELERMTDQKKKTGVRLEGVQAINPVTGENIPVFVADYVLGHYGTGAVMGVPAHDERDNAFARKFGLPIKRVVDPVYTGKGEGEPKEGEEYIKRHAVCAIVHNPKDDTYLCISWKSVLMHGLVTGGLEGEEDIVEAARREVKEETGYKNLKLTWNPGIASQVRFYHRIKKQNRWARFTNVFFELENDERDPVDEKEAAQHEVLWLKRDQLKDFFSVFEGRFILELLDHPDYVYTGEGSLSNSGEFDWMTSEEARTKIAEKYGRKKTTYKLRDWLISRQRYWGSPIPIIYCEKCGEVPVPESDLPVHLPDDVDFMPQGESPLARSKSFHDVACPKCGGSARRESDTMDTFMCSSWYFFRFADVLNEKEFASKELLGKWLPVDLYVGGAEHTVLHLLYARFFTKVLRELGYIDFAEPFMALRHQGTILAEDGKKMSKSIGNVINPDDVVATYGADSIRLYEMFMGPFEVMKPWNTASIIGVRRFLERVLRMSERVVADDVSTLNAILHKTIKKVTDDIVALKFNTAISQLMILINDMEKAGSVGKTQWELFLRTLAPFAPFVTDELWESAGHTESIHLEEWPAYDEKDLIEENVTIAILIDGKTRGDVVVPSDADKDAMEQAAREAVKARLEGREVARVVVIPKKLVNFVLKQ